MLREIATIRKNGILIETRRGPEIATSLPSHFHEELQVILSEKQLISYTLKGQTVLSPLSSVLIVEPGLVHAARVEKIQCGWGDLRTMLIPHSCFGAYLGAAPETYTLSFSSAINLSKPLLDCLGRLHTLMQRDHEEIACESSLVEALYLLRKQSRSNQKIPTQRCKQRMDRVREHLASDLGQPRSLSLIAHDVGLSPFHVVREFRKQFGLSPHAFRTQLRIAKARELLLGGSSISDVAYTTGFSDHAHLTRTFHRIVGVPPSRYRNRNFVQDTTSSC